MQLEPIIVTLSNDDKVLIRSSTLADAELLKEHREIVTTETYFMARYPEDGQFNLERIKQSITSIEKCPKEILLLAYVNEKVIGEVSVTQVKPHLKYLHRANIGISIQQKYTGLGLGKYLMKIAIKYAKNCGYEQIELGVFSDNERAIQLYEKCGFETCGVITRAYKLKDNSYRDEVIMINILEKYEDVKDDHKIY